MKTKMIRRIIAAFTMMVLVASVTGQQLSLSSHEPVPGESFSISLDIPAMNYVGAMSLFIFIDTDILQYDGFTIVMPEAAGTLVNLMSTTPPMIGISWLAPGVTGIDFPAGTMLTFQVTAIDCGDVTVAFNEPLCEIVDWDVNVINVSYASGFITMAGSPATNWNGSVDNSWMNPSNWSNGVPGCNTEVLIEASSNFPVIPASKVVISISDLVIAQGGALTVMGTLNVDNDLTIQSGPLGTGSIIDNGTLSVGGAANIERYYGSTGKWHLISSPITDGVAGLYNGNYLQKYDEPSATWMDIVNPTEQLIPAKGYALWVAAPSTYDYVGQTGTGSTSIMVTNSQPFGWNLLGNAYPSSLDWMQVATANAGTINGAVYYLDAATGNYLSFNGGMGGGSPYVPPMQGFFVSVANSGSFQLDNSMRTHMGQDNYYKTEFDNLLVLQVEGNGYTDATYLRFDDAATLGFDGQFDAYKLFTSFNDDLPQLYTRSSDVNLSINVLPTVSSVELSFLAGVSGDYLISIGETNGLQYIFIEDHLTNQIIDLLSTDYSFSYNTSDDPERFTLHFTLMSVQESEINPFHIYTAENMLHVRINENLDGIIRVHDMMGRELGKQTITSAEHSFRLNGKSVYLISVTTSEGIFAEKVYMK